MKTTEMTESDVARCAAAGVPVDGVHGDYYWIASIDPHSLPPTDDELAIIRSYIEFVVTKGYTESGAKRILAQPFPYAGGHNGVELRKSADSWRYRRPTWTTGSYPIFGSSEHLYPFLVDLFDKIEDLLPEQWQAWKASHPEVFGVNQ